MNKRPIGSAIIATLLALIVWFHIIPLHKTMSDAFYSLGLIVVVFVVYFVLSKEVFIGASSAIFLIFIGLGFLVFDSFHFFKSGVWDSSTLNSLFFAHKELTDPKGWIGLAKISSWLWNVQLWWWLPCIGVFSGYLLFRIVINYD